MIVYLSFILFGFIFIILMYKKNIDKNHILKFISFYLFSIFLIFFIKLTNIIIDITLIILIAYVFKDLIANFGASLYLLTFPFIKENTFIKINDKIYKFKKIEFIRSILIDENNKIHLFPNNILLNHEVTLL